MGIINNLVNFIQNSDNHWILYAIALFLIIEAFVLGFINKRLLTIRGNNTGIAVNGDINGNITQTQNPTETPVVPNNASSFISLLANLSGIAGFIIAAVTFYLSYIK